MDIAIAAILIAVAGVLAVVGRNLIVARSAQGTAKSRERAEREGDLGPEGLRRAEERRRMH